MWRVNSCRKLPGTLQHVHAVADRVAIRVANRITNRHCADSVAIYVTFNKSDPFLPYLWRRRQFLSCPLRGSGVSPYNDRCMPRPL